MTDAASKLKALALALGLALALPASARPGGGHAYSGGHSSFGGSRSSSSFSRSFGSHTFGRSASTSFSRPGGGQSYSGGGGNGFGGGGGDGGGLFVYFLLRLLFVHPVLGLFVLGVVVLLMYAKSRAGGGDWTAGEVGAAEPERGPSARRQLESLRELDPDFSILLFEDFAYALYGKAHEARGSGDLDTLAPWLSPEARRKLAAVGRPREVKGVIVGAMEIESFSGLGGEAQRARVAVRFEANYTEVAGRETSYYTVERWQLSRALTAKTRPPDAVKALACPNCGAPLADNLRGNVCAYCRQTVDTGEFDWVVDDLAVLEREDRGPLLTQEVEEQGTDLPTIVDDDARAMFDALHEKDPGVGWPALAQRIHAVFEDLQISWSRRQWKNARPWVTDQLFQMFAYWIETYQKQGLRNVTEGSRLESVELARVTSDKWFDGVTVRVRAVGPDYTMKDDGTVVVGSKSRERRYTEYWTLVRGAGVRGAPRSDKACPKCGAPLSVSQAGTCDHCGAKITSGQFDFVLSRIEQDESYTG